MTTSVDTNVLIALWNEDYALNTRASTALGKAMGRGALVVSAPVFAELLAAPGRSEEFLNEFLHDTGISADWDLGEAVWRLAGRGFQRYVRGRRKHRDTGPRRILADFLIGAHALHNRFQLLTLDERVYKGTFPQLDIAEI